MKKITLASFIAVAAVALAFLAFRAPAPPRKAPSASIETGAAAQGPSSTAPDAASPADGGPALERLPMIPLKENEVLLKLYSAELDSDPEDEQVLLVKKTDDPTQRIWLIVADYDGKRGTYERSWEDATEATNVKTFSLDVKDILGAHGRDLVCAGLDDSRNYTLTVFWREMGEAGGALKYAAICRIKADGGVRVDEAARKDAYLLGQANDLPWRVLAYGYSKPGGASLDQVESTYEFDYVAKAYVKTGSRAISGATLGDDRLRSILDGDSAEGVKGLIAAMWYKADGPSPESPAAQIIYFDPSGAAVVFFTETTQDVYVWKDQQRTKYGLYIATQNSARGNMERFVTVDVAGAEELSVKVYDDISLKIGIRGSWDGQYKKIGRALFERIMAARSDPVALASSLISGSYARSDGVEYIFSYPDVEIRDSKGTQRGGYAVFKARGQIILETKTSVPDSSRTVERQYLVEPVDPKKPYETIRLVPVKVGISSTVDDPSAGPPAVLTRKEEGSPAP